MPKKFIKSFKYAQSGAEHAIRTQRNLWIHLSIALLVIVAGIWLKLGLLGMAMLVLSITSVISAEMLNTALEEMVNLLSPEQRPAAALAKNVAAGAVLLAAVGAGVVGILIFLSKVI